VNPAIAEGAAAALLSPEFEVAAGALTVLAWTRDVRHAPAIARAAEDERLGGLAAEAIEALGPGAGEALGDAVRALAPEARMAVMGALARVGDASVLPELVDFVGSEEEHLRAAAIESLGRLGDPRAVPLLMRLLADPDAVAATVAGSALELLSRRSSAARRAVLAECRPGLGRGSPPSLLRLVGSIGTGDDVPALRAALAGGDAAGRAAAAWALAALPLRPSATVLPDLLGAMPDAAPAVRAAAAQAAGRAAGATATLEPAAAEAVVAALCTALADPEPVVSAAAAEALGLCRCEEARPALEALVRSATSPPEAAVAALRALGALGAPDPGVLASAARHPDPEVVKEAVALAVRVPGPAGASLLLDAAAHRRWDVRQAAARALAAREERALLGPVRRLAAAEEDPLVASALADAARRLEGFV
jgi:HEAT repeat protein